LQLKFFLTFIAMLAATTSAAELTATPADLATIRERMTASLLPPDSGTADALIKQARADAAKMSPDHSWPDIDYSDGAPSAWLLRAHIDRALLLAKAFALTSRDNHPDPALAAAASEALAYWIEHDPHNRNWWWNEIGVPQLTGETALLLGTACPTAIHDGVIKLLNRSIWTKWTGQNLVWGAGNQIVRGLLTSDPALVSAAYQRIYQEVIITPGEGIQADYSFHQHGAQFYSGGYGLGFAQDVGRYIAYAWSTGCQPPLETLDTFNHFMLDGQAWMTWGHTFDFSALGREITRQGKAASYSDWTGGPIVPIGAAYDLARTAYQLSQLPIPRQSEYASFAHRLLTPPSPTDSLNGHKHFWRSDYTSHRRPDYFFSVKMFSTRVQNTELTNAEGKLSHHLGDGNTFLYLSGNEYRDIFPVWDWTKLPGTTAEQSSNLEKLLPGGNHARGTTSFVGGVSDGTYGASAMLLHRGSLSAKKSWFFLDDQIICLGSDISSISDNPIATTLNQCFLNGPVTQSPDHIWIHHDHVGYLFPGPHQDIHLSTSPQTGSWFDIGTGSHDKLTSNIFKLWLAHPAHSAGASYSYVLLPNVTPEQTAFRAAHPDFEILAQSSAAHAIRYPKLDLTAIVFFSPGKVADIEVDHPCILLLRGHQLTVANPENQSATLHITCLSQSLTLHLPGDDLAGSSVTTTVP
jgi:chondroitin AC lyase